MTGSDLLNSLDERGQFRIRPGLARIKRLLEALGNPQDALRTIHIAGTNGKGSVAASLESILRASGYKTGLYTSPHLLSVRERIKVNGIPSQHMLDKVARQVVETEKKIHLSLTYFEFLTACAFLVFRNEEVDVAVLECGLGGKWDATNIVRQPVLSIITTVGYDHMQYLGRTLPAIATQKAGIIKSKCPVVSGVLGGGRAVIERVARSKRAPLLEINREFSYMPHPVQLQTPYRRFLVTYQGKSHIMPYALKGNYQHHNAALVFAAVMKLKDLGWRISTASRDKGLKQVIWPGRFQVIQPQKGATLLLDGAHNAPAMKSLLQSIGLSPLSDKMKTFVFSAYRDKDIRAMGRLISEEADEVCVCPMPGTRGARIEQLRPAFSRTNGPVRSFNNIQSALAAAYQDTPSDGLIIVTGSLALVASAMQVWNADSPFKVYHV